MEKLYTKAIIAYSMFGILLSKLLVCPMGRGLNHKTILKQASTSFSCLQLFQIEVSRIIISFKYIYS